MFIGTVITIVVSIMILMMKRISDLESELKHCQTKRGGLKVKLLRKIKKKYDYYFIKDWGNHAEMKVLNKKTGRTRCITMYSWRSNILNAGSVFGMSRRLIKKYKRRTDLINFYKNKKTKE